MQQLSLITGYNTSEPYKTWSISEKKQTKPQSKTREKSVHDNRRREAYIELKGHFIERSYEMLYLPKRCAVYDVEYVGERKYQKNRSYSCLTKHRSIGEKNKQTKHQSKNLENVVYNNGRREANAQLMGHFIVLSYEMLCVRAC